MKTQQKISLVVLLCAAIWLYFNPEGSTGHAGGEQAIKLFNHEKKILPDYFTARIVFWKQLYPHQGQTLYCGKKFANKQRKGVNIEHVFPMSWVKNAFGCETRKQCRKRFKKFNQIEADLHNLYPSRSDINQERSSFAFAEIASNKKQYIQDCNFKIDYYQRKVEPRESVQGDIARAMFYMVHQYKNHGLKLYPKQKELLYRWHLADPPSQNEIQRNKKIFAIQGNENIFISQPQEVKTRLF